MLIINILGLALIGFVIWWFWLYRPTTVGITQGIIPITVENGVYSPALIRVGLGQEVTLRFLRKDNSPCSGVVLLDDFDVSEELPLNKEKDITIKPSKAGNYSFTCQMKMYSGELVVEGDDHE